MAITVFKYLLFSPTETKTGLKKETANIGAFQNSLAMQSRVSIATISCGTGNLQKQLGGVKV